MRRPLVKFTRGQTAANKTSYFVHLGNPAMGPRRLTRQLLLKPD